MKEYLKFNKKVKIGKEDYYSRSFTYKENLPEHLKSCRLCMQVGCDICITFKKYKGYN